MRTLEIAGAGVLRLATRQKNNRSEQFRQDHRQHGLLLVGNGQSYRRVAVLLGETATAVQRWVRRVEESGFAGLRDADGSGRPRALDTPSWPRITADLRRSPAEFGLRADRWDGPVLSERLRCSSGGTLGIRQCQRMSRPMGFRLRKPRPQAARSDPQAVAAAVSGASSAHVSGPGESAELGATTPHPHRAGRCGTGAPGRLAVINRRGRGWRRGSATMLVYAPRT